MKKKIVVLFGGESSEYSVSLQSASAVIRAIDTEKYEPVLIGITKKGQWFHFRGEVEQIENDTWQQGDITTAFLLPDSSIHGFMEVKDQSVSTHRVDAAFPVLHGKNGEDGTIQGLLQLAGIPCIGCGILSSALCMDKDLAHKIAASIGVKVPRSIKINRIGTKDQIKEWVKSLSYPLFVKPVHAGSSFGITRIEEETDLLKAVAYAFAYDTEVVLEEAVDGFEVGCAIMGKEKLIVGEIDEIELSSGFFDFTEKYTLKTSKIHMPARITEEMAKRIKETACQIYRTFGCSGFARVDLFLSKKDEIYFNEINTIPGFTSHSRFPNMMKGIGYSFEKLVMELIEQEVENI